MSEQGVGCRDGFEDSGLRVKVNPILTQVATYKILASRLKLWAKMNPHTLRVVA
jgi:hypothetical protein